MTTENHSPDISTPARKGPAPVMEDMRNRGVVPDDEDPLSAARGIMTGVLYGLGAWALIIALFTVLLSQSLLNLLSGFLPPT